MEELLELERQAKHDEETVRNLQAKYSPRLRQHFNVPRLS